MTIEEEPIMEYTSFKKEKDVTFFGAARLGQTS